LGLGAIALAVIVGGVVVARRGLPHFAPLDALRQMHFTPTLADLQKAVQQHPQDAKAHARLAHAYFDKGMHVQGAAEDERALRLDPKLASDQVASEMVSCFGTPAQGPAASTIGNYHMVQAADGLEKLTSSKQYGIRTAALGTLQKIGKATHSDYFRVWTADLDNPDCEVRRHAVAKLGELGDKRAVEPIHEARLKDDKNTPWYGFRCIGGRSDDATKQILGDQSKTAQPSALARR
jgi:HEAT repeat protein